MEFLEKSDEQIKKLAQPIWDNLIKTSNIKDYGGFTKDFSSQMLYGAERESSLANNGQTISFLRAYPKNKNF